VAVTVSVDLAGMLSVREYAPIARRVEELGFDELHVFDDLMQRPVWPILALMGAATERIRIGPAIVSPRIVHPAYQAASLAELDELTDGRAVCAIGRGAFFEWLGMDDPERPLTMLREAITLMKRLLAGDTTPFEGSVFRATPELALHFPVRRADVPIWLGTWSPKTCELAGEVADGVYIGNLAEPEYLRVLCEHVAIGARRAGRDPASLEIAVAPVTMIGPDRKQANDAVRPMAAQAIDWLHPMTTVAGVTEEQLGAIRDAAARGDAAAAAQQLSDANVEFFSLTGTPADVVPRIQALVDAGATHVSFGMFPTPGMAEALELIGAEVLPEVRALPTHADAR
jgi:5,10-methylenetetrahydromethanopterin reductase